MKNQLSNMTLEELWQLFPIVLTEHKNTWKEWYCNEENKLKQIFPVSKIVRISHIGSTAVDSIWAKPIIDILVEVLHECDFQSIKEILVNNGYICMLETEKRKSFNKGYTVDGFAERVFHLHLRYAGDHDELYFRDYLQEYLEVAKDYEKLKLGLWKKYEHNRDVYTDSKTNFIKEYTKKAKVEYFGRYE